VRGAIAKRPITWTTHLDPSLEKFGAFIVRNLRDKMLFDLSMILSGRWKAPSLQELQTRISRFSETDKGTLCELAAHLTTTGMHDLLLALQDEADADGSVRVFVDGREVAKLSDGLHGEIFGEDGWIARFSEYPAPEQSELSRWAKEWIQETFGDHD
jgi:hypothetical protein